MESPTGLDKHKWKDRCGSCTADGKFARRLCRAALRPWTALAGGALSQLEVAQALFILLQRINAEAGGEILCKDIETFGYRFDFPSGILRLGMPERLGIRLRGILSRLVHANKERHPPPAPRPERRGSIPALGASLNDCSEFD
jgi:hypothetical protein